MLESTGGENEGAVTPSGQNNQYAMISFKYYSSTFGSSTTDKHFQRFCLLLFAQNQQVLTDSTLLARIKICVWLTCHSCAWQKQPSLHANANERRRLTHSSLLLSSCILKETNDFTAQAWQMALVFPNVVWPLTPWWPLTPVIARDDSSWWG